MSRERIAMMEAYGATVILTDAKEGMAGAIRRAPFAARRNWRKKFPTA